MIVVDTSIAVKWILTNEEYSDKALKLLEQHLETKTEILVPELLFIEVANVLVTKSQVTEIEVKKGIEFLIKVNLKSQTDLKLLMPDVSKLAKKHKTSVYDMLYAVLAKENKTILITTDEKFVEKTGFRFVEHIKDF